MNKLKTFFLISHQKRWKFSEKYLKNPFNEYISQRLLYFAMKWKMYLYFALNSKTYLLSNTMSRLFSIFIWNTKTDYFVYHFKQMSYRLYDN